MEKMKQIADNKITWLFLGSVVGSIFGDQAAGVVNTIGGLVMAVL